MALFDDEPVKVSRVHVLGQDLALLSVEELADRVVQLKAEIARLETEMQAKGQTRLAAEALFRR